MNRRNALLAFIGLFAGMAGKAFGKGNSGCPVCGATEQMDAGKDQYFLMCYGRGYWEREYYPPQSMKPVDVCGKCGTVYMTR